ncbi:MAG: response regulator [Elusimicrobia bacterium]|nr:response regulator [Elusimicrobiota bacterium]
MDKRPNRIMIVDRDPVARKLLAQYIAGKGWDVVSAAGPEEALRSFAAGSFRIVLTGIDLERWLEGIQVVKAMLQRDPHVCVALMTCAVPHEEMVRHESFGPLLFKPLRACDIDALLRPLPTSPVAP